MAIKNCLRCSKVINHAEKRVPGISRHSGRGICVTCWYKSKADGTLDDYPRLTGYKEDRLEDYTFMRKFGRSVQEASESVGVSERTGWRYERDLRKLQSSR